MAVDLWGESFALYPEGISDYAMMEFTARASSDDDSPVPMPTQMRAVYELVTDTIAPEDRTRFRNSARKNRASLDELMRVVQAAQEQAAARPTEQPSDSSPGLTVIPQTSESVYEKAERLSPGRPDLVVAPVLAEMAG